MEGIWGMSRFKICVRAIAGRDQQELGRLAGDEKRVYKIRVFCDDDSALARGNLDDLDIGCAVSSRKIQGVPRIMPGLAQVVGKSARELGIHHKVHVPTDSSRFT